MFIRSSNFLLTRLFFGISPVFSRWSTYGFFALNDPFLYLPNITGLAIGIVQLVIFLCYRSTSEIDTIVEEEQLEESDYDRVLLLL